MVPIDPFDLNRTIFNTLDALFPGHYKARIAKEVVWYANAADEVTKDYAQVSKKKLPPVSTKLMKFLVEDCDFDVEHADGSFLDHLYYCYEYSYHHFPEHSPLVMLLHSILERGRTHLPCQPARSVSCSH